MITSTHDVMDSNKKLSIFCNIRIANIENLHLKILEGYNKQIWILGWPLSLVNKDM